MPRFGPINEFGQSVQSLLDALFDEYPVYEPPSFVASAAYQLRRTISHSHACSEVAEGDIALPRWAGRARQLGPYERRLLGRLLRAERGLLLFTGGTGSGKTSILNVLEMYLADRYQRDPSKIPFLRDSGAACVLKRVDLYSTDASLHRPVSRDDSVERRRQRSRLLSHISRLLLATFEKVVPNETRRLAIVEKLVWGSRTDAAVLEIDSVLSAIKQSLPTEQEWELLSEAERLRRWHRAVETLKPVSARTTAALLPFIQLGIDLRAKQGRFVLVLDNVDQFPPYLQSGLYQSLSALVAAPTWRASDFTIVLSMRPSSALDAIGTIPLQGKELHETPDPGDIVFIRATLFLLRPDAFTEYQQLPPDTQAKVYWRLVQFWVRCIEERREFAQLISGLSGTNIRNACLHAKAWCASERLEFVELNAERTAAFTRLLPAVLSEHIIQEIGSAVGRGIVAIINRVATPETRPEVASSEDVAVKSIRVVAEVLRDLRVLKPFTSEGDGPRCLVGRTVRDTLVARIRDVPRVAPETLPHTRLASELCEGISSWKKHKTTGSLDILARLSRQLDLVANTTFTKWSEANHYEYSEVVEWVCRWVSDTIDFLWRPNFDMSLVHSGSPATLSRSKPLLRDAVLNFSHPSAFESARILFEASPPWIDEEEPLRAVNLFTVSGGSLCPLKLRVLYLLSERTPVHTTVGAIQADLERHGYREDDFRTVVAEILRTDRRLVYSSVNDFLRGVDQVLGVPDAKVHLSWAGHAYFEKVCVSPVYFQWAMSDVREIALRLREKGLDIMDISLRGRLSATLEAFRIVIEDENQRLVKARSVMGSDDQARIRFVGSELTVQSASLDVFFRSMGGFLAALRAHGRKFSAAAPERHESQLLIQQWLDFGRDQLQDHAALFGHGVEDWGMTLEWAKRHYVK